MEDKKIWIAITSEDMFSGEGEAIARILTAEGFDAVHLRHPGASHRQMLKLIEEVPQVLHSRLHLHGHFDLVNEFNLGGLHLNRRCPTPPKGYIGRLSASCHSVDEVVACAEAGLAYVTLSPVFDSISKPGYRKAFTPAQLSRLNNIAIKVIALGGVTQQNVGELDLYNFAGYAMLGGAPWKQSMT